VLAMLSGVPCSSFSRRTGSRRYHLTVSGLYVESPSPGTNARRPPVRPELRRSPGKNLYENPMEWYHFERFLGPRLK
jgi:hypothetical protein